MQVQQTLGRLAFSYMTKVIYMITCQLPRVNLVAVFGVVLLQMCNQHLRVSLRLGFLLAYLESFSCYEWKGDDGKNDNPSTVPHGFPLPYPLPIPHTKRWPKQIKGGIMIFSPQVELVLDMEETSPGWLRQRVHIAKHVEYPNKTSKVFHPSRVIRTYSPLKAFGWK